MKHQHVFDRTVSEYDKKLSNQITRYLFAEYANSRKPLTASEIQSIRERGIPIGERFKLSHAEAISMARDAVGCVDLHRVGRAFLAGVEPARIIWRTPLRAFAICCSIPAHRFAAWRGTDSPCKICGVERDSEYDPVSSGHFVARDGTSGSDSDIVSAAWTLRWFAASQLPPVGRNDFRRLELLLDAIAEFPATATSVRVAHGLSRHLGGNKYNREAFMETLGLAGVLATPRLPGLINSWTPWSNRPQDREMIAPANLWKRADGFDAAAFAAIFPECKLPTSLQAI